MKKLFTLALVAAAATTALAQDVQTRLQIWGPFPNTPEDAVIAFNATDYTGDLDDASKYHFYIWENTISISEGMDGTVGTYQNFICGNLGWAGAGLNVGVLKNNGVETGVTPFPAKQMDESWRLHFLWKTNMAGTFTLQVGPTIGNVLPEFSFDASTGNHDGTWNEVDIPITDILDQYVNTDEETLQIMFFRNWTDVNLFGALALDNVPAGGEYSIVDMYFYTNQPAGVESLAADGAVVAEEYYSFDGKKLAEAPANGLYLVKKSFENGAVKTLKVAK